MQTVPIQMPDGSTVPVTLFPSEGRDDAPVIVVLPGLGIPGGYYRLFAEALVARGFHAAIGDLRGQGDSKPKPSSSSRYGYQELVSVDFPAIFEVVREQFPAATPYLLGHSMGGQLGAMYAARIRGRLGGLILVASGSPYHRGFPAETGRRLRVGAAILPLIGLVTGSVPARFLGGTGAQPTSRMRDWARLVARGTLQPARADIDYPAALREGTVPILLVAIAGDEQAPESAGRELLRLVPAAPGRIDLETTELGHNRWARTPEPVVRRVLAWLDEQYRG